MVTLRHYPDTISDATFLSPREAETIRLLEKFDEAEAAPEDVVDRVADEMDIDRKTVASFQSKAGAKAERAAKTIRVLRDWDGFARHDEHIREILGGARELPTDPADSPDEVANPGQYRCPSCGGGFPHRALTSEQACPWCEFAFGEGAP